MKSLKVELLAPAGSTDAMKAAYSAGADAVYIGGNLFGARAYAENSDIEGLLSSIDYAHIRDKRLYLTVNTLLKNDELKNELYNYIRPLYEEGLDACIVQDLGVFKFLHENFPEMHLHASTQMTITGAHSAKLLQEMGASRVVTARELSLEELKNIRKNTNIEIESFIHGAICYSYSGQCMFSSLAGGRSGNRGRCAQPCRMGYSFYDGQTSKPVNSADNCNLLSLKDMNTLDIIPSIIEAGVYSLKIEGRMKQPVYTAGVVSIYRKYVDKYLAGEKIKASKEDQQNLFNLFNRDGFSRGYYEKHNGADMIAIKDTKVRTTENAWTKSIHERYVQNELKAEIVASADISMDYPVSLILTSSDFTGAGAVPAATPAQNRPLDYETVKKQLSKMGSSDYKLKSLEIRLADGAFMTIGALNELRRSAVDCLTENILNSYRRTAVPMKTVSPEKTKLKTENYLSASVHLYEQLKPVLECPEIGDVYVDHTVTGNLSDIYEKIHVAGKRAFFHFPNVFRKAQEAVFDKMLDSLKLFDGYLIGSLEALGYVNSRKLDGEFRSDYNLYSFNDEASAVLETLGFRVLTASPELNFHELKSMDNSDRELIIYGRTPMMTTANCLHKTLDGCRHFSEPVFGILKDKDKRSFPVEFDCRVCENVIYNCVPTYIGDMTEKIEELGFKGRRIALFTETALETERVLETVLSSQKMADMTRGHFNRGVE